MRILHLCLGCFYIDGYNYQENILPRLNKEDGHEVEIIASTETYIDNQKLGYVEPSEYVNEDGIKVIRLPYATIINQALSRKIRSYKGLFDFVEDFCPDIIMSHSLCYYSSRDVVKYVKMHPEVTLYADTHTAKYNSGRNWFSHNILHRMIYKSFIKKVIPYVKKYFYIGEEEKKFSVINYGVPEQIMEFLPLGGILPSDEEYEEKRSKCREELGIDEDTLLFVHSGKMNAEKKTVDLMDAFSEVQELKAKLVIIGSIADDVKEDIEKRISNDTRIQYLGWKSSGELLDYLCASDLYCQPGSPSATLQNAICRRNPVMANPGYGLQIFNTDNFLWVEDKQDIVKAFHEIASGEINLDDLRKNSIYCANELLDYKKLARRIYK